MSGADLTPDRIVGFTVPTRHARGRIARLGPTLNLILSAHAYPEPLARLLAEALVLTALVGATLRPDEGQMTMQAQATGGAVDLLVCDYVGGSLRGYLRVADEAKAAALTGASTLTDVFGEGYLAITLDQTMSAERYQGIVPLEGDTLVEAVEAYFDGSEQIPTLIRIGVDAYGDGWTAGGLLVQHLPQGEVGRERLFTQDGHPDWRHVRTLGATITDDELTDPALALEELLWRLFNEDDPRVLPAVAATRGCRCSTDYVTSVLRRFADDDIAAMRGADGVIRVDCAFCARSIPVQL